MIDILFAVLAIVDNAPAVYIQAVNECAHWAIHAASEGDLAEAKWLVGQTQTAADTGLCEF